jgi:hypothetical protein
VRDRFLYASSPDRGLHRLLSIWPALWDAFHTPLSITYDLFGVLARHGGRPDPLGARLRRIATLVHQPGVVVHGPLGEAELAGLRARARALLYPLDPVLPASELYALSVLECCAAGVPLVLSPVDVFPSEYKRVARFVDGFEATAWVQAVREVLEDPTWTLRARAHAATRSEEVWVAAWEDALRPALPGPPARAAGQRWLALSVGIGHGEAALAREVVDEARRRGHEVEVVINHPSHLAVLPDARVATSAEDVLRDARGAERLVLSSSMTCLPLLHRLRRAGCGVPIASIEARWPEWLGATLPDLIVTNLSPELFRAGMAGDPPSFRLRDEVCARMRCAGPLPGTRAEDKLDELLLYLGQGADWAAALLPALSDALRGLAVERGLTLRVVGPDPALGALGGVRESRVGREAFCDAVARARLVVTHPGAGTVGLARASGTPVLCVTTGAVLDAEPGCPGERQAQVWFEAGWVEHLSGPLPASRYRETLAALLDQPPPAAEGGGASRAVSWIEAASCEPGIANARPPMEPRP